MTPSWLPTPHFKVETGTSTFIDTTAMRIQVVRPENNIAFAVLSVDDYKSKNYIDVFDALNNLDISFYYGSDTPTKVFSSDAISTVAPKLGPQGETLECGAWGKAWKLLKTHCNAAYGVESSLGAARDDPRTILEHVIDEHVNKSFGGAATGYSMAYTLPVHNSPVIRYLDSKFRSNFDMVNIIADLRTADQAGSAGAHWFVDPDDMFWWKSIDIDKSPDWPQYWQGTAKTEYATQGACVAAGYKWQSSACWDPTIEVTKDMILYDFKKNIEHYANNVLLHTAFRKPAWDFWTEFQKALWGSTANITLTDANGAGEFVVGSYSLCGTLTDANVSAFWYPSTENAGWDLTAIGSEVTPAYLSFYYYQTRDATFVTGIYLATDYTAGDHFFMLSLPSGSIFAQTDEWSHISIPVGPYHGYFLDEMGKEWTKSGNADWSNINSIQIDLAGGSDTEKIYIDDLHFAGKIVREAKDTSEITDHDEYQWVMRNDTAIDDSMVASDDSGTAAMLTYAELLRRATTPIVGIIKIPGAVNMLPGQWVHVHACKKADGSFRIDKDFRVKELTHLFEPQPLGFTTTLNLTDDLLNAHAFAAPTAYSLLAEYAGPFGQAEARNLKAGGTDIFIPLLSKSY